MAKATSGCEALAIEPLDLVMAVRQTLGDMNDSIRHTGVPVKATMPESAIVQADSGKLYRVLQNILDNALRYSLVGTRIYLEVSRGDIATRLTLTNTASYEMNFAPDDVLQRRTVGSAVPRSAMLRPFPIKRPQPPLLRLKQPRRRNQKSRRLRKACRLLKQRKTAAPPPPFPLPGGGTVGVKSIEPPNTKHKTQKRSRIS